MANNNINTANNNIKNPNNTTNNNINNSNNAKNTPPKFLPGADDVENPTVTGNTERQLAADLVDSFELLKENGIVQVADVKDRRILSTESQQILDHNQLVRGTGQGDIIQVQGNYHHNTLSAVFEDSQGALRHEVKSSQTPPIVVSRRDYYYDEQSHL